MKTCVVLCTYNGEGYLREQLDSIANQTLLPDDILFSDDASTDGTIEIIRSFVEENKQLKCKIIVNEQNLGYQRNFSNAIYAAKGDILFLCDQDDIWEPDKVESFVDLFRNRVTVDLVFSDLSLVDYAGKNLGLTFRQSYRPTRKHELELRSSRLQLPLLRYNLVTGASMAFRSNLVSAIYPIPEGIPHDYWIALIAASRKDAICSLERPFARYRLHTGQAIGLGIIARKSEKANYSWVALDAYYIAQIRIWKTLNKRIAHFSDPDFLLRVKKKLYESRANRFHALRRRKARSATARKGIKILWEEVFNLRYKYSRGFVSIARDICSILHRITSK